MRMKSPVSSSEFAGSPSAGKMKEISERQDMLTDTLKFDMPIMQSIKPLDTLMKLWSSSRNAYR